MAATTTTTTASVHPGVIWAQRHKLIFVTIEVSDTDKPEIKVRVSAGACAENEASKLRVSNDPYDEKEGICLLQTTSGTGFSIHIQWLNIPSLNVPYSNYRFFAVCHNYFATTLLHVTNYFRYFCTPPGPNEMWRSCTMNDALRVFYQQCFAGGKGVRKLG